jgi:hypothetical protein
MDKLQTSIEWLALALYENAEMKAEGGIIDQIIEEAKKMHKQEIIDAFKASDDNPIDTKLYNGLSNADAEQYYQETFK